MNSVIINIAGRHVPLTILLLAAAALPWLLFVAVSTFSRTPQPKGGMRASERNLVASSAVLLIAWCVAFDALALFHTRSATTEASAMGASSTSQDSCASVTADMSSSEVLAKIGKADEVRNDDRTRGPGAETWLYKASRCSVAMLDGKVEAVE
jgi:hypothetical protein